MQPLKLERTRLSNGLNIIYCHTPHTAAFELSMHINTGSRDETVKNNGISHFLEHMMFRGSEKFSNSVLLSRALESMGGESNAMTSIENTSYWLKGAAKKTEQAIEYFSEFFLSPNFADLETERSVILQELASDINEEGKSIDTEALGMAALFGDHSLGLPIIGTEETIKAIGIAELQEKRKNFYTPERCVLTIHTAQSFEETLKILDCYFGKRWPYLSSPAENVKTEQLVNYFSEKTAEKKPQNGLYLQNNPDNQFALKLLFPTVGGFNKDVILINFLQRILDDGICTRLPANIREKHGLVYDISCNSQFFNDIGTFSIDATVSEDKLEILIEKLAGELRNLIDNGPSTEEIEHIKFRYHFDIEQIRETPTRLLTFAANTHFIDQPLSLEEEYAIVNAITKQDIQAVIQRVFNVSKRGFVLVGPKARKKRDLIEKFLKTFD